MTMKRLRVVAGLVLALLAAAGPVHAIRDLVYVNNAQAVTDTGVSISFTDNGSGGNTAAFIAQSVFVKNKGANEVFCDLRDTTATTSDFQIEAGDAFTFAPTPGRTGGYAGIGCITSSGETTTIQVRAQGQ